MLLNKTALCTWLQVLKIYHPFNTQLDPKKKLKKQKIGKIWTPVQTKIDF